MNLCKPEAQKALLQQPDAYSIYSHPSGISDILRALSKLIIHYFDANVKLFRA